MTNFAQHGIQSVAAERFDYKDSPLRLSLQTEWSSMPTEIILFLNNDALTSALVKAINDVVAAHKQPADDSEIAA